MYESISQKSRITKNIRHTNSCKHIKSNNCDSFVALLNILGCNINILGCKESSYDGTT